MDLGIKLHKEELERLIACFDTDELNCLNITQFLTFFGEERGEKAQASRDDEKLLQEICSFEVKMRKEQQAASSSGEALDRMKALKRLKVGKNVKRMIGCKVEKF